MKQVIRTLFLCVAIMYSIAISVSAASEWDVIGEKDLQKPWTITFSDTVDVESIPEGAIIIQNAHGEEMDSMLEQQDEMTIVVKLRDENMYEPNHTYTLTIAPFESAAGVMLSEEVTMTFTTASEFDVNPEFLPKIEPTPLEAYKDQALVTLSYDDGYQNWYTKALRLHSKFAMPGTFNVNTYRFDEGNPDFMSYSEVWVSHDRGIEIGAHTHEHKRLDLSRFSEEEIRYQLAENIRILDDLGIDVKTIAAPNSAYSEDVREIVMEYFEGVRVFGSALNTPDNYDPYWLKSYAVQNTTTLDEMKAWVDEAVDTNSWLIIMLHNVVDEPIYGCANGAEECDELYDISTANLEALMAYIRSFDEETLLPVNTYEGLQMTSKWAQ